MYKENKGFTLIELLVVIAIVGILSSIVIASINSARIKSRDTQRLADLRQIRTALELYANDNAGLYPVTSCPTVRWTSFDSVSYSGNSVCQNPSSATSTTLSNTLREYIKDIKDPRNLGGDSGYLYISSTGADYCILIYRTPENMKNFSPDLIPTNRCSAVDSSGNCTGTNTTKAIFFGTGSYQSGC